MEKLSLGRLVALLFALASGVVFLGVLLTPMHGNYDPGMPKVAEWAIERSLAGEGKFISYRMSLLGGNLGAAYVLSLAVLPAALLLAQLGWDRKRTHRIAGAATAIAAAPALLLLGVYHLFALIAAIPGWGCALVAALLVGQVLFGALWALASGRLSGSVGLPASPRIR